MDILGHPERADFPIGGREADHEEEVLKVMAKAMSNAREIGPDYETAKRLAWVAYCALLDAKFKVT
jgi:L-ribulose-5-phosphate 3-epimerase UlaE